MWIERGQDHRPYRRAAGEVDAHYIVAMGALGDITSSLRGIALKAKPQKSAPFKALREAIFDAARATPPTTASGQAAENRVGFARSAGAGGISRSPTSAPNKMWMARMYSRRAAHTCVISNGFAAMGSRCRGRSPPSSRTPSARSSRSPAMPAS